MTDHEALNQAVRERLPQIHRGLLRAGNPGCEAVWCEDVGFIPLDTIEMIEVAYHRIREKNNAA